MGWQVPSCLFSEHSCSRVKCSVCWEGGEKGRCVGYSQREAGKEVEGASKATSEVMVTEWTFTVASFVPMFCPGH